MAEGQSACVCTAPQRLQKEKSREIKRRARFPDRNSTALCLKTVGIHFFPLFCEAHTLLRVCCDGAGRSHPGWESSPSPHPLI